MPGIPESQLDTWSHQGSVQQSSDTYASVKNALEANTTKYAGKSFRVFLQGSYGNDTNIYAESDVDVVICMDSIYYYDTSALTPQDLQSFQSSFVAGTYSYDDYKSHVVQALESSFGKENVVAGPKAIKIKPSGNRRSADVIAAMQFRRYYSGLFGPTYEQGICFFNSSGRKIINYPEQHSANCTAMHQATDSWFKPTVRILKNMRSKLVEKKMLADGSAPSYFLEGMLYNVPKEKFGTSYADTFVAALTWLNQTDRTKLMCANGIHSLARDGALECWPCANCDGYIANVIKLWNDWK